MKTLTTQQKDALEAQLTSVSCRICDWKRKLNFLVEKSIKIRKKLFAGTKHEESFNLIMEEESNELVF